MQLLFLHRPLEDSSQVRSQYDLYPDSLHPGNDAAVSMKSAVFVVIDSMTTEFIIIIFDIKKGHKNRPV